MPGETEPGRIRAPDGGVEHDRGATPGDLARAGAIVFIGFAAARALGYLRVLATAAIFGAGVELDAFYAAFRLPDLALNLVATGAIASAVVPAVAPLLAAGNREQAARTSSFLLTLGGLAFAVFGLLIAVAAPVVVPLLAPGFGRAQTELAIQLTREMAPAPLLLGVGAMVAGVLNSSRRFAPSVLGPIGYNVVTILSAILLSGRLGVHALSLGVVAGSAVYLAIQLLALRGTGIAYRPLLGRATAEMRRAVRPMIPRAFGLSTAQFQLLVLVAVASTLGPGSVTVLVVAYTLFQIPAGTLGVPIGTVALPELSVRHASGSDELVGRLTAVGLRLALFTMLPIATIALALAGLLVPVLFGYGSFDTPEIAASAVIAGLMFLGLPGETATALLARALYAIERTRDALAAAAVDVAVSAVLAVALAAAFGLPGIGAALAISASLEAVILGAAFGRRVPAFRSLRVVGAILRMTPVAVVAAPAAAITASIVLGAGVLPEGRLAQAVAVVIGGGSGLLVYLAGQSVVARGDVRAAVGMARSAMRRSAAPVPALRVDQPQSGDG